MVMAKQCGLLNRMLFAEPGPAWQTCYYVASKICTCCGLRGRHAAVFVQAKSVPGAGFALFVAKQRGLLGRLPFAEPGTAWQPWCYVASDLGTGLRATCQTCYARSERSRHWMLVALRCGMLDRFTFAEPGTGCRTCYYITRKICTGC